MFKSLNNILNLFLNMFQLSLTTNKYKKLFVKEYNKDCLKFKDFFYSWRYFISFKRIIIFIILLLLFPYILLFYMLLIMYKYMFKYLFLVLNILILDFKGEDLFYAKIYKKLKIFLFLLLYDPLFKYIPKIYYWILDKFTYNFWLGVITKFLLFLINIFGDLFLYVVSRLRWFFLVTLPGWGYRYRHGRWGYDAYKAKLKWKIKRLKWKKKRLKFKIRKWKRIEYPKIKIFFIRYFSYFFIFLFSIMKLKNIFYYVSVNIYISIYKIKKYWSENVMKVILLWYNIQLCVLNISFYLKVILINLFIMGKQIYLFIFVSFNVMFDFFLWLKSK